MNAASQLSSSYLASHPKEAANILQGFPAQEAAAFLNEQSVSHVALVLEYSIPYISGGFISDMDPDLAAKAIIALTPEHAIPPLRHLKESVREKILDSLPANVGNSYRVLLQWPAGTAGAIMNPFFLVLTEDMTISEAMKRTRSERKNVSYFPYVVDSKQRLVGSLSIRELMQASPKQPLKDVVNRDGFQILGSTPIEHIIRGQEWKSLESIPVVDEEGILLGAIRKETMEKAAAYTSTSQASPPWADGLLNLSEYYGRTAIELVPMMIESAFGLTKNEANKRRNDHH